MKTLLSISILIILTALLVSLVEEPTDCESIKVWTKETIDECHPNFIPNTNIPYRNDYQKYND